MKFPTLMIIKAVVCLVLGVVILVAPQALYGLFGATLTAGGVFAAKEYGASLIGNLMVAWFGRNAEDSTARRAVILGLCVYDAIGALVTLAAVLDGSLNALGWAVVVLYTFFAVAFGFFFFRKP